MILSSDYVSRISAQIEIDFTHAVLLVQATQVYMQMQIKDANQIGRERLQIRNTCNFNN